MVLPGLTCSDALKDFRQITGFHIRDIYSIDFSYFCVQDIIGVIGVKVPQTKLTGYEGPIETEYTLHEVVGYRWMSMDAIRRCKFDRHFGPRAGHPLAVT